MFTFPREMTSRTFLLVAGDFVQTGGMDRANYELSRCLAKQQYEVHLAAHFADRELLKLKNVAYHHVIRPGNSHLLGEPFLDRAGRHWARKTSAHGGHVIVNGGNCRWHDINWVHYVHAAYEPVIAGPALRRARWRFSHRRYLRDEYQALTQARVLIVNSERTKRDVVEQLGVPAKRVHCVYYGIDPSIYRPLDLQGRAKTKERLGWGPQPVVAFVGAMSDRRKGFETVFDAWKTLAGRPGWDVDLAVIGTGAELPNWISRAQAQGLGGRIHFLGFRSDVPLILEACDALVAPARYEAFGMAVQEALCLGLPALASRSSGVAEQYPDEMEELLLDDPADCQELTERLWHWRQRKEEFEGTAWQLSSRLRAHTWEKMTEEILRIVNTAP